MACHKCTTRGINAASGTANTCPYREALARFTEFSNLRLGVYTPYAHENSNQSLIKLSEKNNIIFKSYQYNIKL